MNYAFWFNKEILDNQTIYLLCFSPIHDYERDIQDIEQYKHKYNDFKHISAFIGDIEPTIIHIANNHSLIVYNNGKLLKLFYFKLETQQLSLIRKYKQPNSVQVLKDTYKSGIFYVIQNIKQTTILQKYQVEKSRIGLLKESIVKQVITDTPTIITSYNESLVIFVAFKPYLIIFWDTDTNTAHSLNLPKFNDEISLYFYPEFQRNNTIYVFIQSKDIALQLYQEHSKQFHHLNWQYKLDLPSITSLSVNKINKIFLLDLVKSLPSIQNFCLWQQNDYEAVKYLLVENLLTYPICDIVTSSVIYLFKHEPVQVVGILKYLDLYCFLTQQCFTTIVKSIYKWLPGYRSLGQQHLNEFPMYIDFVKQHLGSVYSSDEETVWNLLCKIVQ